MTHYMDANQSKNKTVYLLRASLNIEGMKLTEILISSTQTEALAEKIQTDRILKE